MARIPEEQIERIKQEISLVRLAEGQGYVVSKQGKDYAVSCPFHEEHTPSCIISPKSNLFNCFGCGAAGSVIDWVMKTQNLKFREAVVWLKNDCLALDVQAEAPKEKIKTEPQLLAAKSLAAHSEEENQQLLHKVIHFYHETLLNSPEALEYLEKRGLNDPELIAQFKLGYANRTLGKTLPNKRTKEGDDIRSHLEQIGLYRETGHEHFNGSLVVPVFMPSPSAGAQPPGAPAYRPSLDIKEVYGRKLLNNLRAGTPKHLYLPGPHQGVWNIESLQNNNEIILCESLIDAMTFWVHGFKNVTTSYGTSGFTPDHLAALKEHNIERVLIAYDRDEAGNNAAEKLAKTLENKGVYCYRIELPKGMDVNEYALTMSPPRKSLELVIKQAKYLGAGEGRSCASLHPRHTVHPEHNPGLTKPQPEPAPAIEPTQLPIQTQPGKEKVDIEISDTEILLAIDDRNYRVRGLNKATNYQQLKINLCASYEENLHIDQLDLYHAKQRQHFIKQASIELGVAENQIKKDVSQLLVQLEKLQSENIQCTVNTEENKVELTQEEETAALEYLRDPSLLSRLLSDFETCGVVGEETNKLVGYLACVSRKLDKPLAVIIQSSSAAGKSSLMDAVLNLIPEEERIQYSAMTGQALFYMGETNLKHKILAIAEEEGAENASYALKLLQSDGEVSIASTGKNEDTGNLETKSYTVEGPVMLFLTTTAIDIDEELMNRCVVLTVNESREQTEAIHALQRKSQTLEGLLQNENKKHLIQLHRNAQRLLRPLKVVNPYAEQLTFLSDKTRTRRDHMKYLQLINSIALLHQYQREIKHITHQGNTIEYIEVSLEDIQTANELAHDVLGRSLDELPPQTRKLLTLINDMVRSECQKEKIQQKDYRFSRRHIRDVSGWSDNQLKVHCRRLEELEYLLVHRGGRGSSIAYELLFDGENINTKSHLMGLLNTEQLKNNMYDKQKLEQEQKKLVPSCPQVGTELGPSWDKKKSKKPIKPESNGYYQEDLLEKVINTENNNASHRTGNGLGVM